MFQTDFTPVELAARRASVRDAIGPEAVALLQGAPKESGHELFRQSNDFYYLCGVSVPHAYLLLDGRDGSTTLYLPHQSEERAENEGRILSSDCPELVSKLTGIERVLGPEDLGTALSRATAIYTPFRGGEVASKSWDTLQRARREANADPWEAQPERTRAFVALLRQRLPQAEIRDLCPTLDHMRLIKSDSEIAMARKAGRLSALGVIEAMRLTRPGVFEYQIDAAMRYVYLVNGARDTAYRAIIPSGENIWYGHYNDNDACMRDGDMVLVDCAPDYHYYTSDIGRMWPVNGRYTALQRELYQLVITYHKVFLDLIRPGVSGEQITAEAADRMRANIQRNPPRHPLVAAGAEWALEFPIHMSHPVGMAVHDVGHYRGNLLQPGMIISLDPTLRVPSEHLYYRVEDTLLITEDGNENLTAAAPLELDEVEALVGQGGILADYPAES